MIIDVLSLGISLLLVELYVVLLYMIRYCVCVIGYVLLVGS